MIVIAPDESAITRGRFLGWAVRENKKLGESIEIFANHLEGVDAFAEKCRGGAFFYSLFSASIQGLVGRRVKFEYQVGLNREDIPDSPAYKIGERWFVGVPIREEIHLIPGAD